MKKETQVFKAGEVMAMTLNSYDIDVCRQPWGFVISFPEIQELQVFGDSYEEAMKEASKVLDEWLEENVTEGWDE